MSLSSLRSSSLPVVRLLSPLPAPRVTVLAAHRACQHDRFPEEKQREPNPCSAERPCGADTSQRSGREATASTLRCARRAAAVAMVAAAGQQWYAGRQQEHEAGAQIPVARGIGSVLVANCALKNEKSGAARADSTRPSGADCGIIRILIVSKDTYPYLVIRHVEGLTLSFHLHHWGPLAALRDSLSTNISAFGT